MADKTGNDEAASRQYRPTMAADSSVPSTDSPQSRGLHLGRLLRALNGCLTDPEKHHIALLPPRPTNFWTLSSWAGRKAAETRSGC
jgi:hypothetical protein